MNSFLSSYKIKLLFFNYKSSSHRENKNLSSKERYKVSFPLTNLIAPQDATENSRILLSELLTLPVAGSHAVSSRDTCPVSSVQELRVLAGSAAGEVEVKERRACGKRQGTLFR